MQPQHARSQARLLAPAALAVSALAVLLIVLSSGGGEETRPADTGSVDGGATTTTPTAPAGRRASRATYTVKRNDNLGTIAEKTGIEVERLQELNPELDPQAISPGQKIKLRE